VGKGRDNSDQAVGAACEFGIGCSVHLKYTSHIFFKGTANKLVFSLFGNI